MERPLSPRQRVVSHQHDALALAAIAIPLEIVRGFTDELLLTSHPTAQAELLARLEVVGQRLQRSDRVVRHLRHVNRDPASEIWCGSHHIAEATAIVMALAPRGIATVLAAPPALERFRRAAVAELGRRGRAGSYDPSAYTLWLASQKEPCIALLRAVGLFEDYQRAVSYVPRQPSLVDFTRYAARSTWPTSAPWCAPLMPEAAQ
jgi:hypothetical protein